MLGLSGTKVTKDNVAWNCGRRKRDPWIGHAGKYTFQPGSSTLLLNGVQSQQIVQNSFYDPTQILKIQEVQPAMLPEWWETENVVNSTNDFHRHGAVLALFELTIIPKIELRHQPWSDNLMCLLSTDEPKSLLSFCFWNNGVLPKDEVITKADRSVITHEIELEVIISNTPELLLTRCCQEAW